MSETFKPITVDMKAVEKIKKSIDLEISKSRFRPDQLICLQTLGKAIIRHGDHYAIGALSEQIDLLNRAQQGIEDRLAADAALPADKRMSAKDFSLLHTNMAKYAQTVAVLTAKLQAATTTHGNRNQNDRKRSTSFLPRQELQLAESGQVIQA